MRRITRYTFKNPANAPKIKKIIKPNGLVSKYLSTIRPIPTPTTNAAMISVLILNPNPAPLSLFFLELGVFDDLAVSIRSFNSLSLSSSTIIHYLVRVFQLLSQDQQIRVGKHPVQALLLQRVCLP